MKRTAFFTILIALLLVAGGCKKKGAYKHACPPIKGAEGTWKMVYAEEADGTELTDSIRKQIGGELLFEFYSREGNCVLRPFVEGTEKMLYGSINNAPKFVYRKCQVSTFTGHKYIACYAPWDTLLRDYRIPYFFPKTAYPDYNGEDRWSWVLQSELYEEDGKEKLKFISGLVPSTGDCAGRFTNDGLIIFEKIK